MRSKFFLLIVAVLLGAWLLSACGGATPTPTPEPTEEEATVEPTAEEAEEEPTAEEEEATPEEAEEEGAAEEEAIDGETLVQERCTVCHDTGRIDREDHTEEEWAEVVDEMIEKGAELTDEERQIVIEYLASR